MSSELLPSAVSECCSITAALTERNHLYKLVGHLDNGLRVGTSRTIYADKEDGCVSIDLVTSWLTPAIKNGGREPTPEPELALATAHMLRTPR